MVVNTYYSRRGSNTLTLGLDLVRGGGDRSLLPGSQSTVYCKGSLQNTAGSQWFSQRFQARDIIDQSLRIGCQSPSTYTCDMRCIHLMCVNLFRLQEEDWRRSQVKRFFSLRWNQNDAHRVLFRGYCALLQITVQAPASVSNPNLNIHVNINAKIIFNFPK